MTVRGRAQAASSSTGKARKPDLSKFYRYSLPDIRPGDFTFELTLLRGGGAAPVPLAHATESLEWRDEEATLQGSLVLRRPVPNDPGSLPIGRGHRVRCRVQWGGQLYELWQMRVLTPEVDAVVGTVSVDLLDDLDLLRRHERDWTFKKDKAHPRGWYAHEIARVVARRTGVKLGRVARGTKRISLGHRKGKGALDILRLAYASEHDKTGRRFVIRLRDGELDVVPYSRNRVLYVLGEQLTSAMVRQEGSARPVTVITGKARIGKGKDARTIRHTEYRRDVVNRFGYVHRDRNYGHVDSADELKGKVRRSLAAGIRVKRSADVEFPGIPFIRRGDGCQLALPNEGFAADRSFVFVTSVAHRVEAGVYTTSCSLTADDSFEKYRETRERELRAKRRRARERARN